MKCLLKSVKFSDVIQVILEPENLREDLQKARTSDLSQRQADKARRERLLSPILTKSHRKNIFNHFKYKLLFVDRGKKFWFHCDCKSDTV